MLWKNRPESDRVEDRRGSRLAIGGGIGTLIVVVIAAFLGINPGVITNSVDTQAPQTASREGAGRADDQLASFTKVVFNDTDVIFKEQFDRVDASYQSPTLVLYDTLVESACGRAASSTGPFYCPADARIYIDLSFYRDMDQKLDAEGDFARAYVVAHEVGHHVQQLLGYSRRTGDNSESVRMELQADYLAGVWAHHAEKKFNFLEDGDIDEALNAAAAVGDDRLQEKTKGEVIPDSFTHGTSAQRVAAFREGFDTGDLRGADKFFSGGPYQLAE